MDIITQNEEFIDKKFIFVYVITNLINNKQYVGQHTTNKIDDGYFGSGKVLKQAIKKYGSENFSFEVLEILDNCSQRILDSRETDFIIEFNTISPNGYNLKGEDHRIPMSDEIKKKISDKKIGIKMSEETKNKISDSNMGKFVSEETKNKISDSNSGKRWVYNPTTNEHKKIKDVDNIPEGFVIGSNFSHTCSEETKEKLRNFNLGREMDEETKEKIRVALKGRIVSEETKEKLRCASTGQIKSEETRMKIKKTKTGCRWYHHPITFETRQCREGEQPKGFILGRCRVKIKSLN